MDFFDFVKSKETKSTTECESFQDLMKLAFNNKKYIEDRAEKGDLMCQQVLYTIYAHSEKDNSTIEKFSYYSKLAAYQNDVIAQINYARIILKNINELIDQKNIPLKLVVSIKKQLEESLYWFKKAYENGENEVLYDINMIENNLLNNRINPLVFKHGLISLNRTLTDRQVESKLTSVQLSEELLKEIFEEAIYLRYCYNKYNNSVIYNKAVMHSYDYSIKICELLQERDVIEFDPIALMSSYYLIVLADETLSHVNNISNEEKEEIINSFLLIIGADDMVHTKNYIELIRMGACWILRHRASDLILLMLDKNKIIKEKQGV